MVRKLDLFPCIEQVYSAEHIREMDRHAIEQGWGDSKPVSGIRLMKRAGRSLFQALMTRWPKTERIYVFCGSGNNGGDGYIVAALAKQRNLDVRLIEVTSQNSVTQGSNSDGFNCNEFKPDALIARDYAIEQGVIPRAASAMNSFYDVIDTADIQTSDAESAPKSKSLGKNTVIVDALLGIGFNGALRPPYGHLIHRINQSELPVISADIASGLSADTGQISEAAVRADLTLTFIAAKIGLYTGVGREYSGDIYLDSLGFSGSPDWLSERAGIELLDLDTLLTLLPKRTPSSHKGIHGHLVIIGGDRQYGGAVILAAEAALRTGAGMVSVITRAEHRPAILARCPEVMVVDAANQEQVNRLIAKANSVVIGPGLGQKAWGQKLLQQLIETQKTSRSPCSFLFDADALNILATKAQLPTYVAPSLQKNTVFTPHPGEAARLLGDSIGATQQDRLLSVKMLCQRFGATVLLKGSGTVIGSATEVSGDDAKLSICPYGNSGMSSAGMGDVLSGVVGSLLAQGMDAYEATQLGCALHSYAADLVAEKQGVRGLLASDLFPHILYLTNRLCDKKLC